MRLLHLHLKINRVRQTLVHQRIQFRAALFGNVIFGLIHLGCFREWGIHSFQWLNFLTGRLQVGLISSHTKIRGSCSRMPNEAGSKTGDPRMASLVKSTCTLDSSQLIRLIWLGEIMTRLPCSQCPVSRTSCRIVQSLSSSTKSVTWPNTSSVA